MYVQSASAVLEAVRQSNARALLAASPLGRAACDLLKMAAGVERVRADHAYIKGAIAQIQKSSAPRHDYARLH